MRTQTLSRYLEQESVRRKLTSDAPEDTLIGIGRDPEDARRNCIVLYVPAGFSAPLPQSVTLGGEAVRVVRRERGGKMVAYGDAP